MEESEIALGFVLKFLWFLLFVIWFFSSDLELSASDLKFPSGMLPLPPLKKAEAKQAALQLKIKHGITSRYRRVAQCGKVNFVQRIKQRQSAGCQFSFLHH
jgi:hypothetical protein